MVDPHQPTVLADIQHLFAPPPPRAPGQGTGTIEEQPAQHVTKGPARLDVRESRVSSELAGALDWPSLAQVVELRRTWTQKGRPKQEVHSGITSLPQAVAPARRVLSLKRTHWGIANRLHYVNDVSWARMRGRCIVARGQI